MNKEQQTAIGDEIRTLRAFRFVLGDRLCMHCFRWPVAMHVHMAKLLKLLCEFGCKFCMMILRDVAKCVLDRKLHSVSRIRTHAVPFYPSATASECAQEHEEQSHHAQPRRESIPKQSSLFVEQIIGNQQSTNTVHG